MIQADNSFYLVTGSKTLYEDTTYIYSVPSVPYEEDVVYTNIYVLLDSDPNGGNVALHEERFSFSDINAYSATGAEHVDKFYNQIEQAVVAYLEAITENSGIVFSII